MRHCPHCSATILITCTRCPYCQQDTAAKQLTAGPLSANDNWTEDKRPDGTTYRTVVARSEVPARDVDYDHLARILPDMQMGERSYGFGLDVLAEQWPWVYSKAVIQKGMA